jgi:hypothetical protein
MLTTEEMNSIIAADILGLPQTVKGPDADKFLAEFQKDRAEAEKAGYVLDIPAEWPNTKDEED